MAAGEVASAESVEQFQQLLQQKDRWGWAPVGVRSEGGRMRLSAEGAGPAAGEAPRWGWPEPAFPGRAPASRRGAVAGMEGMKVLLDLPLSPLGRGSGVPSSLWPSSVPRPRSALGLNGTFVGK